MKLLIGKQNTCFVKEEGMTMKKVLIFLVIGALLLSQTALSETVTSYEVLEPTYCLIDGADYIRENMLRATLYVSVDEIWFSGTSTEGGPWIVKANAQGEIISQHKLRVDAGERITIHGMNKTPNGLLLGIIDNKTTLGSVGLLKTDGQISYTDLGNAKIHSYVPMQDGILAQGVLYDESKQTCAPQTIRIDQNGQIIFKRTGTSYDIGIDGGALTSSVCCASNNSIFVLEARGSSGTFHGSCELVCLDLFGQEKWRVTLDSNIVVYDMTAADDKVYIFGFWGEWDEEGLLLDQQATIQCFSQDGACQWTQRFKFPAVYQRGDAGMGISVASSMENGIWYICVIGTDGTIQKMIKIDAQAQYINHPYIISDEMLVLLGMTEEQLMICNITI